MKIEEYVDSVSVGLNDRRVRESIRDELRAHLEDSTEELVREGHTAEEAEELAVKDMGDPNDTVALLNEVHKPIFEWKQIIGLSVLSLMLYYPINFLFHLASGDDGISYYSGIGLRIKIVLGIIISLYAIIVSGVERYLDLPFWYGRSQNGGSNANGAILGAVGIILLSGSFKMLLLLLVIMLVIIGSERNFIERKRLLRERRFIFTQGTTTTDLGSAELDPMHYSSKVYEEFGFPGKAEFDGKTEKVIARRYIPKGSTITVIGIDGFKLKVD